MKSKQHVSNITDFTKKTNLPEKLQKSVITISDKELEFKSI